MREGERNRDGGRLGWLVLLCVQGDRQKLVLGKVEQISVLSLSWLVVGVTKCPIECR